MVISIKYHLNLYLRKTFSHGKQIVAWKAEQEHVKHIKHVGNAKNNWVFRKSIGFFIDQRKRRSSSEYINLNQVQQVVDACNWYFYKFNIKCSMEFNWMIKS